MSDDTLLRSLQSSIANRDKYAYGSENWRFFNKSVERIQDEVAAQNRDDRCRVRGPWNTEGQR